MANPYFTIGHSNRSVDEFIGLLRAADVRFLVDVRLLPGSRANPQFDQDALAASLADAGVGYLRSAGLTGRRGVSDSVPPEVNGAWRNQSFHNYADHALSGQFSDALEELRELGRDRRTTVMCSEAVWWRCHRRIIADHLLAHDENVRHIMAQDRIDPATLTPGASVHPDRSVTYPLPG
ncbi:DUF488 domain-containing protein [Humibacter antri]